MPNSGIEPHGNVTASATPFSRMSRTSGADEPQSSSPFCNGCDGGTQCAILSSNVLSCAIAALAASIKTALSAKIFIRINVLPLDRFSLAATLASDAAPDNCGASPHGIVPSNPACVPEAHRLCAERA